MEGYVTIPEAAAMLGIGRVSLWRHVRSGAMPAQHVHRRLWLIAVEDVERWRERGKLKAGRKPRTERAAPDQGGEA